MTDFEIPDIFGGIIPSSLFIGVSDMKTLTLPQSLKEIGDYAFRNCSSLEKIYFPETLEIIGRMAFCDCTSLKEIKFGKNIKEIRDETFCGCISIEKVDIGDLRNWCSISFPGGRIEGGGVPQGSKTNNPLAYAKKIYLNGKELNELIIPDGITTINPHVFNNCQRFDKLVIPSSVTSIGDYAFSSCGDLDNIVFKSPVNLQSIEAGSFSKCISLTNVTIPDCVTSLGTGAFRECTNLVNIKLPAGLTELPSNMFYGCTRLPSVDLPETLKTIGDWAFFDCSALTRIDIPASVEYIGTEAFKNTSLQGVYIRDMAAWCNIKYGNLQDGGGWAYEPKESNPLIRSHNLYLNGELVTDLVIPEGVETIESGAFWGGTCIRSVKLPSTLKTIKDYAFTITRLRDIMIPNSVESIAKCAFSLLSYSRNEIINVYLDNLDQWFRDYGKAFVSWGYYDYEQTINLYVKGNWSNALTFDAFGGVKAIKVENLVVPNSITNLNDYALYALSLNSVTLHKGIESVTSSSFKYSLLNYVYSQAKFPPSIYSGSSQATSLFKSSIKTIYVPKGRGESYKTKWSGHADIIKEADQEMSGVQSAESITEMVDACTAINGNATYIDLTNATLDETVTAEALGAGEDNVLYYLPSGTTNVTGDNIVVDGVAESVSIHDGEAVGVPVEFMAKSVSFLRTLSAGGSYTICLPYDFTLPEGMKAYSLNAERTDGKLQFAEVESLKANEPYLIVSSSDVESLNAVNVKMEVTPEEMNDAGISDYEFRGTLQGLSYEEASSLGAYVLQDNFTWVPVVNQKPDSEENAAHAYNVRSRKYAAPSADDVPSIGVSACHAYLVPKSGKAGASIEIMLKTINEVLLGDANGDGAVDIADAICIVNHIVGAATPVFIQELADVDNDNAITIADAVYVINLIIGK